MGHDQSRIQPNKEAGSTPAPRVKSTTYFGGNGQIGDIDDDHINETLRDLNLERLYQRAPQLRVSEEKEVPVEKLKTLISISNPNPSIKTFGNINVIVFGLLIQAPTRVILIANNFINSMTLNPSENRFLIGIPIPAETDFTIEMFPDFEHATTLIPEDYTPVIKHVLFFRWIPLNHSFKVHYPVQKLFVTDYKFYQMTPNYVLERTVEENNGLCMCCLTNQADTAVAQCDHKVFCSQCVSERQIRVHHCPFCNEKSTM